MVMKAMTLGRRPISTSSNRKRSLRPRRASSTVLYCVEHTLSTATGMLAGQGAGGRRRLPLTGLTVTVRFQAEARHARTHGCKERAARTD
jgi:hypothetical protein